MVSPRTTINRPVCFSLIKPKSTLLLMENRHPKSSEICNATKLITSGELIAVYIPLVCLYPSITKKVVKDQTQSLTLITPAWHTVPRNRKAGNAFAKPLRGGSTPNSKWLSHLAGMETFRQDLSKSRQKAAALITNAWRPNTNSNYKLVCDKWASY